jgi:DNA-binding CsgD family transcriptional regulator
MVRSPSTLLEDARRAHSDKAWRDAVELFLEVDRDNVLAPGDLEALAWSAAMCGHDNDMIAALERLHTHFMEIDAAEEAARVAFWIGIRLLSLGEPGRGLGWVQRCAERVQQLETESVYQGYLLLPQINACRAKGEFDEGIAIAARAVEIGRRFDNADLIALAGSLLGDMQLRQGKMMEGFAPVGEAMLLASSGATSPVVAGIVLCAVVATCFRVGDIARAREWTAVLSDWCGQQPQIGPFGGICLVHRAEIKWIECDWDEALTEARSAAHRLEGTIERSATAAAHYLQAEIHRQRGSYVDAERKYADANSFGLDPQPGLSQLRMAQQRTEPAITAVRRAVVAARDPQMLVNLLFASVEILLGRGEIEEAAIACERLEATAATHPSDAFRALAAHAHGRVNLAAGDTHGAAALFKSSFDIWSDVGATFKAAQVRVDLAAAYGELADWDSAELELAAAEAVFARVAAQPEIAAIERVKARKTKRAGGLTARETEVLGHLADGKTNREIAAALGLSAKTINRHVENIFNKLGVSSRAAAAVHAIKTGIL